MDYILKGLNQFLKFDIKSMSEFYFYLDNKETIWRRSHCTIQAENEQEALQKMSEVALLDDFFIHSNDGEILFETSYELSYEENGNQPTVEVYYNNKMVADNTPLHIQRDKKISKIINETN